MVLMEIDGVYSNPKSAYPQVVLKERSGPAYLPIVIGRFEAAAIAAALAERLPVRPISYDLAHTIVQLAGGRLLRAEITELHEGTYYAMVHLQAADGSVTTLDSRPSDAIALALRQGAGIYAAAAVLREAGFVRPAPEPPEGSGARPDDAAAPGEPSREGADAGSPALDPIAALERRLEQAVAEELYEEAARLRDEISRLRPPPA
jgi:bifunctional DNase/RNase